MASQDEDELEIPMDPAVLNILPPQPIESSTGLPFGLDENTIRSLQQFLESQELHAVASEQVGQI